MMKDMGNRGEDGSEFLRTRDLLTVLPANVVGMDPSGLKSKANKILVRLMASI